MPAGAIPTDPGDPSKCVSTASASVTASQSSMVLGQMITVTWSLSTAPGCSPAVVRLLYRDATTNVVTDTGQASFSGQPVFSPASSGAYYLQATINGSLADFEGASAPVTVGLPTV